MIVFRLIAGPRSERIETDKTWLVLGSSPTADVTLPEWPNVAATLEVVEDVHQPAVLAAPERMTPLLIEHLREHASS